MDDAFDTIKRQRVRAADTDDSVFPGRYLCPVCHTEVIYIPPSSYVPYFRHHVGTPHDACERYSTAFHDQIPLSRHEFESLDATLVARRAESANGPLVALAVRFRPYYGIKEISFESGGRETPYPVHPAIRQQYFQVTSGEAAFSVKAKHNNGREISHHIEGFGDFPALFRASDREAVRIPEHRTLKPGSYLAVSKTDICHRLPPSLNAQLCKTISGLEAFCFDIPRDPSHELRAKIRHWFNFDCSYSVVGYSFCQPYDVSEFGPDCWEVGSEDGLTLRIKFSEHLVPLPRKLLVQSRNDGRLQTEYLCWDKELPEIYVRMKKEAGSVELIRLALVDPLRFIVEIRFNQEG